MIKKITLLSCLLVCMGVFTSHSFEHNYQNTNLSDFQSLPPGALETLSPADLEMLKQKYSGQTTSPSSNTSVTENSADSDVIRIKQNSNSDNVQDDLIVSVLEQQYREGYSSSYSSKLNQFGYDIFSSAQVQPSSLAIPDPAYLLGTGDQLLIRLWGSNFDAEYTGTINREGTINIPKVGIIQLAGVSYGDAESIILREAKKYIQGINISVALTKLRSLEIYVLGAVRNPGLHIVPSFSTVFDGLLSAGGVKKSGSLRRIQLNRTGKLKKNLDIYDLLLKGSRKGDETLQNRDIIFVPGIGETVAVTGAVNNEGIFELSAEKNIDDIVSLAGGILPQAYGSRIYLRRFENNQNFLITDITSASIEDWKKVPVQNGDLIELTFSLSSIPDIIKLEGHVWKPDVFQYKQGIKLSDILTDLAILKPDAVTDFALVYRYDTKTTRVTPRQFPLSKVFSGEYDAPLFPFDRVEILSRQDLGIQEKFSISGAVWKPGEYGYKLGLKLKDVIAMAGGLRFGARKDHVEIARQIIQDNQIKTRYLLLDMDKDSEFELQPFDSVLIPMIKDAAYAKKVTLSGEVAYPGTYTIRSGEKLSAVIERAGGFTDRAYYYGARFTSEQARNIQQKSINKMIEQLQLSYIKTSSEMAQGAMSEEDVKAAEISAQQIQSFISKLKSIRAAGRISILLADLTIFKNSAYDFILKPEDSLHIPEKPSFVSVVGSVYSPGSFLFRPNHKLKYYLDKSGGVAKSADEDYVYLIKANGEISAMTQDNGWTNHFEDTILMPGDTIVVPEDLDRVPYLKLFQNISDIVFKIATTAGVAISLAL